MSRSEKGSKEMISSARATFPRKHKLSKPVEFKMVFRNHIFSSDRYFRILARISQEDCSRLGMAVSRKVDKRAVGRNRIKRVVRESFRKHWTAEHSVETQNETPCLDIVVLPRRESATISNSRLFSSLEGHWTRLENQIEG